MRISRTENCKRFNDVYGQQALVDSLEVAEHMLSTRSRTKAATVSFVTKCLSEE